MADTGTSPKPGNTLIIVIFHPGSLVSVILSMVRPTCLIRLHHDQKPRILPELQNLVNAIKEDCQWHLGGMGVRTTRKIIYIKFREDLLAQAKETSRSDKKVKAYAGIAKIKKGRAYCPGSFAKSLSRE